MEWIKRMNLKKALFTITFINLLIAAVLSCLTFWVCVKIHTSVPSDTIMLNIKSMEVTRSPEPPAYAIWVMDVFSLLQIALPILIFVIAMLVNATLFYRWKLKEPLAVLMDGANRIMDNDLDFVVESKTGDELGQLCAAFETMRQSLLKNHRELWQQAEERKRLNAAFSHDLRNPVTVLKGSAKLARQCAADGETHSEQLMDHLARIENYTQRIERYVEAMGNAQRLEQVQLKEAPVDSAALAEELKSALFFAASDSGKGLSFCSNCSTGQISDIMLDKNVLFEIAENLVSNALRFAKQSVAVTLCIQSEMLILEVADDGNGFPDKLLKNGIQPFQKCGEEAAHFGMGLYICELLCRKHGGTLKIENLSAGAKATAVLRLYTKNAF